ncbi:MAG TPA: hypothetical protein VFB20_06935 [Burkholderiales bacterium]|nr:hypothetical protein [Burkholderiales bacterium]
MKTGFTSETLIGTLVRYYKLRRVAREGILGGRPVSQVEPLPLDVDVEKLARFPFLP